MHAAITRASDIFGDRFHFDAFSTVHTDMSDIYPFSF